MFDAHIQYPYKLVKGKNLSSTACLIYGLIYNHYARQCPFFWTQKTISEFFEISTRTVERAIKELMQKKMISFQKEPVEASNGHGGARYRTRILIQNLEPSEVEPDNSVGLKNLNPTKSNLNPTNSKLEPDNLVVSDNIYEINNKNKQIERTSTFLPALLSKFDEADLKFLEKALPKALTRFQVAGVANNQLLFNRPDLASVRLSPADLATICLEYRNASLDLNLLEFGLVSFADWVATSPKGKKRKVHRISILGWVMDRCIERKKNLNNLERSEQYLEQAFIKKG